MTTGLKAHIFFTILLVVASIMMNMDFSTAFLSVLIFNMMMIGGLAESGDYNDKETK